MNDTVQVSLWIFIGQWSLLLALGFLVIIAYRQLGYLVHLKETLRSVGTEKDGLPLGSQAPSFSYTPIRASEGASRYFAPQENWSLLVIADPECASCRNALAVVTKLAPQLKSSMHMLAITTSHPAVIEAVDEFRFSPIEIGHVEREVVHKLYQTRTTPFLYVIDAKGAIRAKSVINDASSIKKAIREAERSDASQLTIAQPTR
jgi:hypothetical protein